MPEKTQAQKSRQKCAALTCCTAWNIINAYLYGYVFTVSMTLNFVAIVLAITGILNPVIGALVHNAGSVIVIINSAFLLGWHKKLN